MQARVTVALYYIQVGIVRMSTDDVSLLCHKRKEQKMEMENLMEAKTELRRRSNEGMLRHREPGSGCI